MANYYTPPPSSPFPGANYGPRPELYPRPPPNAVDQVQVDVCATLPVPLVSPPTTNIKNAVLSTSTTSVVKVYKTFLQWKAEAKATTADYQCNGYPSPIAWVMTSSITPRLLSFIGLLSRST